MSETFIFVWRPARTHSRQCVHVALWDGETGSARTLCGRSMAVLNAHYAHPGYGHEIEHDLGSVLPTCKACDKVFRRRFRRCTHCTGYFSVHAGYGFVNGQPYCRGPGCIDAFDAACEPEVKA